MGAISVILLIAIAIIVLVIILRLWHRQSERETRTVARNEGNPPEITSRYADIEGVTFDMAKIPENLRGLLPYAKEWAIGDDVERQAYSESAPIERKREFIDAVMPRMDELDAFHESHKDAVPVPDEVVLFDMMAEAAAELYYEVYPNGKSL